MPSRTTPWSSARMTRITRPREAGRHTDRRPAAGTALDLEVGAERRGALPHAHQAEGLGVVDHPGGNSDAVVGDLQYGELRRCPRARPAPASLGSAGRRW